MKSEIGPHGTKPRVYMCVCEIHILHITAIINQCDQRGSKSDGSHSTEIFTELYVLTAVSW